MCLLQRALNIKWYHIMSSVINWNRRFLIAVHIWMHLFTVQSLKMQDTTNEPQLIRIPKNQSVTLGDKVQLDCVPGEKVNYVIWYFQSYAIQRDASPQAREPEPLELAVCQPNIVCKERHGVHGLTIHPSGWLKIHPISREHAGKYECAVVSGVRTLRAHAFVFVATSPSVPKIETDIQYSTTDQEMKEGDTIRLVCKCDRVYPEPELTWLRTHVDLTGNTSADMKPIESEFPDALVYHPVSLTTGDIRLGLLLNLSWRDHDSEIRCKANNRIGFEISSPFRISVLFSPRIHPFRYNPWVIVRDESAQLVCQAVAQPAPVVQWVSHDGQTLSTSPFLDSNVLINTLLMESGNKQTSWTINITCLATNNLGMAQRSLRVELHTPPIVTTNRFVYARIGQSIQLHCEALANPPATRIFWERGFATSNRSRIHEREKPSQLLTDMEVDNDVNMAHSALRYWLSPTLQINTITQDDAGMYRCVAENQVQASGRPPVKKQTEEFSSIFVYYPPGKPQVTVDLARAAIIGSRVKLECRPNPRKPGLPVPTLRWKWRPRSCTSNAPSQNRALERFAQSSMNSDTSIVVFNAIDSKNDGFYTCEAQNGMGQSESEPVSLNVTVPAEITQAPSIPDMATVNQLSPLPRLRCAARGKPAPILHWMHNGHVLSNVTSSEIKHGKNQREKTQIEIYTNMQCVQLADDEITWETVSELRWKVRNQTALGKFGNNPFDLLIPEDEGSYTCEATNIPGNATHRTVRLNLQYPPQRMHQKIIKQAFPTRSEQRFQPSTELLNDPAPTSALATAAAAPSTFIYCIMRSNPLPTKISWQYLPGANHCVLVDREHQNCECRNAEMLARLNTNWPTHSENKSPLYQARLLSGSSLEQFIPSLIGQQPFNHTETTVISQLIFAPGIKPKLGTYVGHLYNSLGCEMCYVQLQSPSPPDDLDNVHIENVTWNSIILSWQTGFDGGLSQTVVIKWLKNRGRNKSDDPHVGNKEGRITSIPQLPATYRCWLQNLEPSTYYQFQLYAENELGRSIHTKSIDIKTANLDFPQLEKVEPFGDQLQLYFVDPTQLRLFCVQVEVIHSPSTHWLQLYNDCPTSTSPVDATHLTCQIMILSSTWYPLVRQNASKGKTDSQFWDNVNTTGSSLFLKNPLRVKKTNFYPSRGSNGTEFENSFHSISDESLQYRIRTCIRNYENVCSPDTMYTVETVATYSALSFLWIAAGLLLFFILGLTVCGFLTMRKKRERFHASERVWVLRDGPMQDRDAHDTGTRKLSGHQRTFNDKMNDSIPVEDLKLIELSKASSVEPVSDLVESCCPTSSQTVPTLMLNPSVTYDVMHSCIPAVSSVGTVTQCSLLLSNNPGNAVASGAQVLSPIISVARPSDLYQHLDCTAQIKPQNPPSSVLLIPATQLSTLDFSAKTEDDHVSLILHIPVHSAPSS